MSFDEGLDVGRLGRQAGQVEAQPAGQRAAIGFGRRLQAVLPRARARMKRSIGLRTHAWIFTGGQSGRVGAMNDQCG